MHYHNNEEELEEIRLKEAEKEYRLKNPKEYILKQMVLEDLCVKYNVPLFKLVRLIENTL